MIRLPIAPTVVVLFLGCTEATPEKPPGPPAAAVPEKPESRVAIAFKDDQPGVMTAEQFQEKYPSAEWAPQPPGEQRLEVRRAVRTGGNMSIGGQDIDKAEYVFYGKMLEEIRLSLSALAKPSMVDSALAEKYGRPKFEKTEVGGGTSTWASGTGEIVTSIGGPRIIIFRDREVQAARMAAEKAAAAKDL